MIRNVGEKVIGPGIKHQQELHVFIPEMLTDIQGCIWYVNAIIAFNYDSSCNEHQLDIIGNSDTITTLSNTLDGYTFCTEYMAAQNGEKIIRFCNFDSEKAAHLASFSTTSEYDVPFIKSITSGRIKIGKAN